MLRSNEQALAASPEFPVQAEAAGPGKDQRHKASHIGDHHFHVFCAECQMVDKVERDAEIHENDESCHARAQAQDDKQRADSVREHGDQKTWMAANVNRVGEMRRHVGMVRQLLYAVFDEKTQSADDPEQQKTDISPSGA